MMEIRSNTSIVSKSGVCKSFRSSTKRLNGGADERTRENSRPGTAVLDRNMHDPVSREHARISSARGQCCFCMSQTTTTGDKKVDDILEYGLQNLQETEKALMNLGESFEHDLKVMFVDIMARVQHWVSIVHNRVDAAKADMEALGKDLIDRVADLTANEREVSELKKKLADAEANKIMWEKLINIGAPVTRMQNPGPTTTTIPPNIPEHCVPCIPSVPSTLNAANATNIVDTAPRNCLNDDKVKPAKSHTNYVSTGCQSVKDVEKAERESELEAELMRLRKDNETIMKERTEYENAIQRALLKGVSSLNVEALKVLRCSPFPSQTPCISRPSSSAAPEPTVTCSSRSMKQNKTIETHKKSNAMPKNRNETVKSDPVSSNHQFSSRNRCNNDERSTDGMVFLLPQGDFGRLSQLNGNPTQSSGARTGNNKTTVCVDGTCGKSAATTDKLTRGSKSSTPSTQTSELHIGNRHGTSNARRKDTNNSGSRPFTAMQSKRCRSCNKNR